jgi:hypothetical protein
MKRRALYAMYIAQEVVDGQPKQNPDESGGNSGSGSGGTNSSSCSISCSSKAQAAVSNLRQLATNCDSSVVEASLTDAMKAVTAALMDADLGEVYAAKLKREVLIVSHRVLSICFLHVSKSGFMRQLRAWEKIIIQYRTLMKIILTKAPSMFIHVGASQVRPRSAVAAWALGRWLGCTQQRLLRAQAKRHHACSLSTFARHPTQAASLHQRLFTDHSGRQGRR